MKIISLSGFATKGSESLPGGFRAFGIHSGSEIDICTIGGHLLGVGQIVQPADAVARAVRGYRTGALSLGGGGETQTPPRPVGETLVLVGYEPHDELVAPGPRAPTIVNGYLANGALVGATANQAVLMLRLPFAGRKQAAFYIRRDYNGGIDVNGLSIIIRGIRYLPRELIAVSPTQQPFIDQIADTWAPVASTVNAGAGVTELVGDTIYVGGGGDKQEFYDELELWCYGTADVNPVIAIGEASGERNGQ